MPQTTIRCHAKPWGNSIGIIVPKRIVREYNIKPHEDILVEIKGKQASVLKELFGSIKFSKSPKALVKEARKEIESKFMR